MAIIKTDSTYSLVYSVAKALLKAFESAAAVAEQADFLGDKLLVGTGEGENLQGSDSWQTLVGEGSASYSRTQTNHEYDTGWFGNGADKYSFVGRNLDGSGGAEPSTASRFSYSSVFKGVRDEPGYLGHETWSERTDALIDFVPGSESISLGNFTRAYNYSDAVAGFSDPGSAIASGWRSEDSMRVSFKGSAQCDLTGAEALVTAASLYAYDYKASSRLDTDGRYGREAERDIDSMALRLSSAAGIHYALDGQGNATLTGSLDKLLLDQKSQFYGAGELRTSYQGFFSYTNSASPADDIDLQVLLNYALRQTDANRGLADGELLKGNDILIATDHIDGTALDGGGGNDKLIGGKAVDKLWGGDGDDVLNGGSGADLLYGDAGDDLVKGDAGDDRLEGGVGDDLLDGGVGNDRLYGGEGDDRLLGGAGNDVLEGNAGDDVLDGGAGHDNLAGGDGNDLLKGGAGQDRLYGDAGDDVLDGGAGNDLLIGGAGRDVMTGGSGLDGFGFSLGDSGDAQLSLGSLDQITGFNVAQDRLLLDFAFSGADVKLLQGAQSYEALLAAAEADGSFIVVGYDAGNTYVFVDMDKNGSLDTAIQLVGIKGDAAAIALQFSEA